MALFLTISFFSCSSDSPDSNSYPVDTTHPTSPYYFTFNVNGQKKAINYWEAELRGNYMNVTGYADNGTAMSIDFNVSGTVFTGTLLSYLPSNIMTVKNSQYFYGSNTFSFTLENINTTNKTVKVIYTGKVFEDRYDVNSNYSIVKGAFYLKYTEISPNHNGKGTFAKINNQDWFGREMRRAITTNNHQIEMNINNSGIYNFDIIVPENNVALGNHSFNSFSTVNKIIFCKYNLLINTREEYVTTGNLVITEVGLYDVGQPFVKGTFSFTATNPYTSEIITVTNGVFKE